jgi:regulator of protease activity HflC (stomatin/prohibitin superfamily)
MANGTLTIDKPVTWEQSAWIFSSIRWAVFLLAFFAIAYLLGHEHGKNRWLISAVGHIAVIAVGWIVNFWMGIIFISIPIIAMYYGALYNLANVILPASNPEDRTEKKKKFFVLASYTWGTQSPITVVNDHAWKKYDARIPGKITWEFAEFPIPLLNKLQRPGLIWTKSHQVATISGGTKFKRVDGPGVAFPGKLERLDQVFDLRIQLRTREIEVVSKDGIRFIARYFTAFRIDNTEWNKETYDTLRRANPQLRGADKLSHTEGSFPFSHARVQATLGVTSTKVGEGTPLLLWDQWVMNVIEDQTRKIISQKNLDEMWRPANDYKFANAMDVIANELKTNSELTLRAAGILLVAARVVNFKFLFTEEQGDEIAKQQIHTWGSEWERKRHNILAEAEAESERAQQEARAYAESLLLNSIAEGLQKTHEINPELPRHVIAMRFLSSLQDYVHKEVSEEEEGEEEETNKTSEKKKRERLSRYFQDWQDTFFSGRGTER